MNARVSVLVFTHRERERETAREWKSIDAKWKQDNLIRTILKVKCSNVIKSIRCLSLSELIKKHQMKKAHKQHKTGIVAVFLSHSLFLFHTVSSKSVNTLHFLRFRIVYFVVVLCHLHKGIDRVVGRPFFTLSLCSCVVSFCLSNVVKWNNAYECVLPSGPNEMCQRVWNSTLCNVFGFVVTEIPLCRSQHKHIQIIIFSIHTNAKQRKYLLHNIAHKKISKQLDKRRNEEKKTKITILTIICFGRFLCEKTAETERQTLLFGGNQWSQPIHTYTRHTYCFAQQLWLSYKWLRLNKTKLRRALCYYCLFCLHHMDLIAK